MDRSDAHAAGPRQVLWAVAIASSIALGYALVAPMADQAVLTYASSTVKPAFSTRSLASARAVLHDAAAPRMRQVSAVQWASPGSDFPRPQRADESRAPAALLLRSSWHAVLGLTLAVAAGTSLPPSLSLECSMWTTMDMGIHVSPQGGRRREASERDKPHGLPRRTPPPPAPRTVPLRGRGTITCTLLPESVQTPVCVRDLTVSDGGSIQQPPGITRNHPQAYRNAGSSMR